MWPHGCSGRRRPRPPARLGDLTSFGAAPRSPPVPSGPSGALHTSGAGSLIGASSRYSARPRRRRSISHVILLRLVQTLNLHRWNCNVFAWSRKVTSGNYVRLLVSAGPVAAFGCWGWTLRPFLRSSSLRRWGFCTTRSLLAACRRRVEPSCSAIPPIGAAASHGYRVWALQGQSARLSETPVAFACWCLCGSETAIAFVGAKWAFLVRFSVAVVTVVSTRAVQGRAVVMAVSYWPVLVVAEVSLVSKSPRGCVLSVKKFAQQGLVVGVSVTKFAQRSRNSRKSAFYGVLGEFCTGLAQECRVLGELCRGPAAVGVRGRTLLRRALGSWAPLLAVLTL